MLVLFLASFLDSLRVRLIRGVSLVVKSSKTKDVIPRYPYWQVLNKGEKEKKEAPRAIQVSAISMFCTDGPYKISKMELVLREKGHWICMHPENCPPEEQPN